MARLLIHLYFDQQAKNDWVNEVDQGDDGRREITGVSKSLDFLQVMQ